MVGVMLFMYYPLLDCRNSITAPRFLKPSIENKPTAAKKKTGTQRSVLAEAQESLDRNGVRRF